jgi:hypothetical protein
VRRAAVQELAQGWKDDPDTLPILKQWATSDDNWALRRAAVRELAQGWKDDRILYPFSNNALLLTMIRLCDVQQCRS